MENNPNNFLPPSSAVLEGLEPEAKITDFDQIAILGQVAMVKLIYIVIK